MREYEEFQKLLFYQINELGLKCNGQFLARQMHLAKNILKNFSYEDLLTVMKFYKIVGVPREYKSLYYLNKDTQNKIDMAKNYLSSIGIEEEHNDIVNERKKVTLKFDL